MKLLLIMQFALSCYSCLSPKISSALCSQTPSIHISHPYKATGKSIVLYISIFTFLDRSGKTKERTEW